MKMRPLSGNNMKPKFQNWKTEME